MFLLQRCTLLLCLLIAMGHGGSATPLALRAAYQFPDGKAWSAAPELPVYSFHTFDREGEPVAVSDSGVVVFRDNRARFHRWTWGKWESLDVPAGYGNALYLTSADTVFGVADAMNNEVRFLRIPPGATRPQWFGPPAGSLPDRYLTIILAANRRGGMVVQTSSSTSGGFPHKDRTTVHRFDPESNSWRRLSFIESLTTADYAIEESGDLFSVYSLSDHGDLVGEYWSGRWVDPGPAGGHYVDTFTTEYRFNATELPFAPYGVTDHGSVFGLGLGPVYHLLVRDSFGERAVSAPLGEIEESDFLVTSPVHGREMILNGGRFWQRMAERDFTGFPTPRPSPDFHAGRLEDLVPSLPGEWSDLRATCVSRTGRIGGVATWTDPATGAERERPFLLLPDVFLPDWNRDGSIDHRDRRLAFANRPWRFWVNDDDDKGPVARSALDDLPGAASPDAASLTVDGLRDIVDFFPVYLDLRPWLRSLPDLRAVEVVLRHEESALNVVFTNLQPETVGLRNRTAFETGFGPLLDQPLASAMPLQVSASGLKVPPGFLQGLREENRGVLLLEGLRATAKPLLVDIYVRGRHVRSAAFPLSLGPVREMFRVLNLRNADPKFAAADPGPWLTSLEDPPNLPDAFLRALGGTLSTLVHVHGFNWGGNAIPAAHAEVFKRFFQSGSPARFIGVTWFGDEGASDLFTSSFDYNENVINAFLTAPLLAGALGPFAGGAAAVFAHSLGNLLAASSIVDHGLETGKAFMLNAAVPVEAFLGEQDHQRLLVHPDWKDLGAGGEDYPPRLRPDRWARLFSGDDPRARLRWDGRFDGMADVTDCLHFYSSGEEVLQPGDGSIPDLLQEVVLHQQGVWVYNEMVKGTPVLAASLTGDIHGGWGFNRSHMTYHDPGGPARPPKGEWLPLSPGNAAALAEAELRLSPFFRPFSSGDSDFPNWADGAWLYDDAAIVEAHLPGPAFPGNDRPRYMNHAKILAEAVPAVSQPAGAVPLTSEPLFDSVDMNVAYRDAAFWPDRSDPEKEGRWLHSDYLTLALPFVHDLYQRCIDEIKHP